MVLHNGFPFVIESSRGDAFAWLRDHRDSLESFLDEHGAVLLRNFDIHDELQFANLVAQLSDRLIEYVYRSTPRTKVATGVYTATEYPEGKTIPLHNENAYQREWPLRLIFFCMRPAENGGGETPLASTVAVTNRIDSAIRQKFMQKKVTYIRNYWQDVDLPWQIVFQTESKREVEEYCRKNEIEFEWLSAGGLRTRQTCEAFAEHPRKHVLVWFNQAHLFHPSSLDSRSRKAIAEVFEKEEDYPRNARYGDGTPIDQMDLEHIRDAFAQEAVVFQWQAGDILMLDNMMVSHGRNPYKGRRRVLTAMCDPWPVSCFPIAEVEK